jgi:hypothetical protein
MYVKKTGFERVDWFYVAQDKYQWRALVNKVMNFGFHKTLGDS